MQMIHNWTRLLADLWNKVKQGSSVPTPSILDDDIVVFVVGPTGSGKSWFIKEATRAESVKSSPGYHPFTTSVQAIRCELTDEARMNLCKEGVKSIVFVDTPSFHTACDDIDAQKEIETWVNRTKHKPRYLGVIYIHRIATDPVHEPIQNHLRELNVISRFSDSHSPVRVHIVVSYDKTSGTISDSKIMNHKSSLQAQMELLIKPKSRWQPSMHQEHFHGEPEVAWRAVESLLTTGETDHGVAGQGQGSEAGNREEAGGREQGTE